MNHCRQTTICRPSCRIFCLVAAGLITLGAAENGSFPGRKVLIVHAYHQGYPWTDGEDRGMHMVLDASKAELKTIFMDAKTAPKGVEAKAAEARSLIDSWKPDVVLMSDDLPVKFILKTSYKDAAIPFVFCGVNWDGGAYGLPYANTAGMYEVALVQQLVATLRKHGKGQRVALLAGDNETSRADGAGFKKYCDVAELTEVYVKDLDAWKTAYVDLQDKTDALLIRNDGIQGWDNAAMADFCEQNARIPCGAVQEEVAPFAFATYAKIAEEQGEWAAQAGLQILAGTKPNAVGETKNKKAKIILNMKIARKLGVVPDLSLVKQAQLIK